jgi:spermidine/putrescine-binding protein
MAEMGLLRCAYAARKFTWATTGGAWGDNIGSAFIEAPKFPQKEGVELDHAIELESVIAAKIVSSGTDPVFDVADQAQAEVSQLWNAKAIQEYDLSAMPNIKGIYDTSRVGNYWASYSNLLFGLTWNTKETKRPEKFEDLLRPEYKGRIGVPDYGWYGVYWLHGVNKALGGDEDNISPGIQFAAQLVKKQEGIIVQNAGHGMKLFQSGEVVMMPFFNGRTWQLLSSGSPAQFVVAKGTVAVGSGLVITAGSPYKKAANVLVNNTLDPELQILFAKWSKYPPTHKDAKLPADLEYIQAPASDLTQVVDLNWDKVANTRSAYLDRWNKEVLGS